MIVRTSLPSRGCNVTVVSMIGDDEFIFFDSVDQFLDIIVGIELQISSELLSDRLAIEEDQNYRNTRVVLSYNDRSLSIFVRWSEFFRPRFENRFSIFEKIITVDEIIC